MSAARKPVIVRKFTQEWCAGYAGSNLSEEPEAMELLDGSGKLHRIDWETVKWVCYLREFVSSNGTGGDLTSPERVLRRRFARRPRAAGLWIRIVLADGDELEGIAANDRSFVDGSGLLLTPPDTRSNTQRVFIPRSSICELSVIAVIGSAMPVKPKLNRQPELFPEVDAQSG